MKSTNRHTKATCASNLEIFSFFPIFILIFVYIYKSRRLRWAGNVARMEEGRSAFKILTGKPTGRRPLGRPGCRWEDNIRKDLEEIGNSARNRVDPAQDRDY